MTDMAADLPLLVPEWQCGDQAAPLRPGQVQVWWASLQTAAAVHWDWLAPDEQQRAARFRFDRDRARFVTSRGLLRAVLGRYLDCAPGALQFTYSDRGKPAIAQPRTELQFNLSHSEAGWLCAVGFAPQLGIDLEAVRPLRDQAQLSQRFLQPREHQAIQQQPPAQQTTYFFHYWTCKEALLKATGQGLAGLSALEIAIAPAQVQVRRLGGQQPRRSAWYVQPFVPGVGYVAALAVSPVPDTVQWLHW